MSENKKIYREFPIENIVHRTASRPFSLYRTVVGKGESCALYPHCHPEAEIFYLEQGAVEFQVENFRRGRESLSRRARFTLRSTKRMKHFPAAIALWCLTPVC